MDQAPPIHVPLRFFLTAPLFGVVAGLFVLFSESTLFESRYALASIVATHLITLGFFTAVMLGALTQMLPVLAGAKIPKVTHVATFVHLFFLGGIAAFSIGLYSTIPWLLDLARGTLGSALGVMLGAILYSIVKVEHLTPTIRGMRTSLLFALGAVALGMVLLGDYSAQNIGSRHYQLANIHSVWAFFGFAAVLIVAVSFQVLPMFYVSQEFGETFRKWALPFVAVLLIVWAFLESLYPQYALFCKLMLALFFLYFATEIYNRLKQRKRSVVDVTLYYWYFGAFMLGASMVAWILREVMADITITTVALLGAGGVLSIMIGMLYKIVPFLVWFHLNAMGYMNIATMNEMFKKELALFGFWIFVVALFVSIAGFYFPLLLKVGAFAFILSMAILEYNLFKVVQIYRTTKQRKPDFDMNAFSAV